MKKQLSKFGTINAIGLVIVLTIIVPLVVSITFKVLTTQNIIF